MQSATSTATISTISIIGTTSEFFLLLAVSADGRYRRAGLGICISLLRLSVLVRLLRMRVSVRLRLGLRGLLYRYGYLRRGGRGR